MTSFTRERDALSEAVLIRVSRNIESLASATAASKDTLESPRGAGFRHRNITAGRRFVPMRRMGGMAALSNILTKKSRQSFIFRYIPDPAWPYISQQPDMIVLPTYDAKNPSGIVAP